MEANVDQKKLSFYANIFKENSSDERPEPRSKVQASRPPVQKTDSKELQQVNEVKEVIENVADKV